MSDPFTGVRIDGGAQPFQIFQQNDRGLGSFALHGRWRLAENRGTVQLRIVCEDDATVAVQWRDATQQDATTWSHRFDDIPAGGLFRVETRLVVDPNAPEWAPHGDLLHHIGVGDLWIIAGQSNAAGYGRGPVHDPPRLGAHVLRNDETWDIATHLLNETTRSTHPNLESANPGHSPYLRFAKDLNDALGYPIGLVQTSLGGSPLSMWNPVENPDAILWKNLIRCVKLAGGRVRGMVWYQGESDCGLALAETYERRFGEFVSSLSELVSPDLPVIVAQLNRCTSPPTPDANRGWSMLREAQRRAGGLGNVAVVPTIDLGLSDGIHTSCDGNILLGSRKARAALGMVHGKPGNWRAPEVRSASIDVQRQNIELAFDHVFNRLLFLGAGQNDFCVEDNQGIVEIKQVTTPARDRVRLELARATAGKTRVHGAHGMYPSAMLRDAEENTPMLGFYGLPVEGA